MRKIDNNIETLFKIKITFETETEIVDISNAITKLVILDDYLDYNFPHIQASIETSDEMVEFLMLNKNTGKFKLFINKCKTKDTLNNIITEDTPLIKNMELVLATQAFSKEKYDTDNFGSEKKVEINVNGIDLVFHPKFIMELDHETFNNFLHNVDRTNLIKYLIGYSLKTDGILFGKDESYSVYLADLKDTQTIPQLFIPNLNFFNVLEYLEQKYGLFKSRAIKYFGLFNAFIIGIKDSVGSLKVKNKENVMKIAMDTTELMKYENTENENAILLRTEFIKINDNAIYHHGNFGDEITLSGFNMNPDSKDKRYEFIKDIPSYLIDFRTGKEIKIYNKANKKTFFNDKQISIDDLKNNINFEREIYYEIQGMIKDVDFTLFHPLRDVKLLDIIDGISNTDSYLFSQIQSEMIFDVELNNRIRGNDMSDVLYTPLTIYKKEEFEASTQQEFYYRSKVFFNLMKVK